MSGRDRKPDSHVCLLHKSIDEQREAVLPFIKEGLENGEQCICVADRPSVDDWYFALETFGVDVDAERQRGSLIVCDGENWRRQDAFTSIQNGREALRMIERALTEFEGVRFAVDAGWSLDPPIAPDLFCHWEATLDVVIADEEKVRILCQYNVNRHSPPGVHSALRTHKVAMIGGLLRSNPYYEAPRILENEPYLNHSDADAGRVEGMLLQLASQSGLMGG